MILFAVMGTVGYLILTCVQDETRTGARYAGVWLATCGIFPALALNVTWLRLRGHTLSTFTRPVPLPWFSRTLDARTVTRVFGATYERPVQRSMRMETVPCVNVQTQDGKVLRLVSNLTRAEDVEWLAAWLRERLGLTPR